jgi:MoaA/NifB/PqqE/SkfB family radical SAM enzyme
MCCSDWLRTPPVGNIQHQSIDEIWNGEKAREIRRSILDGSFKYCDGTRCPFLKSISHEVQRLEGVKNEELKTIIDYKLTILPFKPREIDCSFETSCNLSCPSCRSKVRMHSVNEHEILNIQSKLENEAFKDAHVLSFSSSGDPFGSPFYRKWLQNLNRKKVPHLKQIRLHTNALLWTPKMWGTIPAEIQEVVKSTIISIDAGRPETYAKNRRGSSFERLLENLQFIRLLRKHGPLEHVKISMVVQKNNFMEMPDFIHLGKRLNFDTVYFGTLQNWGTFSEEEYCDRAIHRPDHPRNPEFIDMLKNEIFCDPIVEMGNFRSLLPAR